MSDCVGPLGYLNKRTTLLSHIGPTLSLRIRAPDIFYSVSAMIGQQLVRGYNLITTGISLRGGHLLYILWHPIKTMREQNLIKRSIKLTLSPAACFSACAARWGPRAAGWDTRSRLWWETPSRRCNRNPGPGGPLHLGEGREEGGVHVCSKCNGL